MLPIRHTLLSQRQGMVFAIPFFEENILKLISHRTELNVFTEFISFLDFYFLSFFSILISRPQDRWDCDSR
uniref:Uncharacterized protein n=1 Tax=Anguilla anguilla TaxID=7936 RepID=A0A0E9WS01_ANGAN